MSRRPLIAIGCLAIALHGLGMSRTLLPAQDGLKFIKFARRYHREPWVDVVRGSDQYPLYSMTIAVAEPPIAMVVGEGPDAWRIAAQLVSVVAALLTLIPLFGFSRALFGDRAAILATLLYVLLPIPSAIGRDTLSDSLAILFFASSLRLGEVALRTGRRSAWLLTGLIAGIGYLARPEILLVPVAVGITGCGTWLSRRRSALPSPALPFSTRLASLMLSALVIVGGYAMVKGEVSEKLAVRGVVGLPPSARPKATRTPMPSGLDDARWDFAPKEESTEILIKGSLGRTVVRLVQQWAEGLGWVLLPVVLWGAIRSGTIEGSGVGRRLVGVYVVLFSAVVIRHATTLGYLSGRHAISIVLVSVPWAGAGLWAWARGWPARRRWNRRATERLAVVGLCLLIAIGVATQVKTMHPTRWGHREAGRWLREHAGPFEAVLDTRGWATFVRGGPSYDPWHIRQALADPSLAYVVIGADELNATSRRAASYRHLLAHAGTKVATFPEREGDRVGRIDVYRFQRPDSWEDH